MRGATKAGKLIAYILLISIHAPHAGRDIRKNMDISVLNRFQSTRPMRGATRLTMSEELLNAKFQSTRPMRGATGMVCRVPAKRLISIHAPHAGRDTNHSQRDCLNTHFNPRAPCGARLFFRKYPACSGLFQSTRPMRGATKHGFLKLPQTTYFNPRAPCGARHSLSGIHGFATEFQSTRPMRGATFWCASFQLLNGISIHAPHAGRDCWVMPFSSRSCHFNPRAPCGARLQKYTKLLYTLLRQKAILRQFHAKRRLLKRFSTYKYRNTFLICSANRMGKICTLPLRTTRSLDLPEGMSACSQSARFCFRTFFPSSKTADYPAPDS